MKDPNYQLKDSDIVNEIKGGYVIKVDGKYYVYLKDTAHADNIRTKEEITRQKQEHSSNHGGGSNDQAVVVARAQDAIQQMMVISLMHLISSKIRAMLISFLMVITSTIFLRGLVCQ